MRASFSLLLVACLVLAVVCGCAPKPQPTVPTGPANAMKAGQPAPPAPAKEASLGEKIFTTGIGASGEHVPFEKGSTMFRAKPGGCAACHGEDGNGKKTPEGKVFPPICYSDLCEPKAGKPAMYEEKALANPIMKGLDEEGKPLSDDMPRWKLTDAELTALVAYLKTLRAAPPASAPAPDAAKK
jgi:mono/diheme cytochrome c family protein